MNQLLAQGNNAVGTLQPPASVITKTEDIGAVFFTNVISIVVVLSGLWFLFQLLLGGLAYITSAGDAKGTSAAMQKITDSIVGITIVAAAFIITGIISFLFFGDFNFILNPDFSFL